MASKVTLLGNLTRDPEIRFSRNSTAIVKFGIADNRRWKDSQSGEWVDKPVFIDVTMFGARGEAFAKYHGKGDQAFLEGHLDFDQWEDKNTGQKRSKLYVVADSWEFVGEKKTARTVATASDDGGGADDDTPF